MMSNHLIGIVNLWVYLYPHSPQVVDIYLTPKIKKKKKKLKKFLDVELYFNLE